MYSQGGEGGGAPFPWDLTPQEYSQIYGTTGTGTMLPFLVVFAGACILAHRA
jgi:hypothetical protein